MVHWIMAAVSVHVLAAIFWAGSTMGAAVTRAVNRRLFVSQMLAALAVIAAGTYLWTTLHGGEQGVAERGLDIGAGCAILALVIQAIMVGPVVARSSGPITELVARTRCILANRIATALLSVAAISMATARYL
jgi:hypothetical protein